jgi:hypothetical protein
MKTSHAASVKVAANDPTGCKLSDDLADSCKTLCKICGEAFFLVAMRGHTLRQHNIQITKYKEVHGPFEIIEKVYHKCHLCGKVVLLDGDTLGSHIKTAHKMKEKAYKEQYCINTAAKVMKAGTLMKNIGVKQAQKILKKDSEDPEDSENSEDSEESEDSEDSEDSDSEDSEKDQKKTRNKLSEKSKSVKEPFDPLTDVYYDCNLKHCDQCDKQSLVVQLVVQKKDLLLEEASPKKEGDGLMEDEESDGLMEERVGVNS